MPDDILGIKLITTIRLGFSHLRELSIVTIFLSVQSALVGLNLIQRFSHIRSDALDSACELAKTDVNLLSNELLTKLLLYGEHTF